jgi:hypothetical protein
VGTASVVTTSPSRTTRPRKHRHPPAPGTLPQTNQLPSTSSPAFRAALHDLWDAIRTGAWRKALPAFFPEAAYLRVKAIASPGLDYEQRLLGDFRLDVAAAHALLGTRAAAARLVSLEVPGGYVHWVAPGACYNRVGYYEVPNSRLVYRLGGTVRSLGIASMISWRGVWYVVHLGAVVRQAAVGIIDDPRGGAGSSIPVATC